MRFVVGPRETRHRNLYCNTRPEPPLVIPLSEDWNSRHPHSSGAATISPPLLASLTGRKLFPRCASRNGNVGVV
jgi:hypothetical protein